MGRGPFQGNYLQGNQSQQSNGSKQPLSSSQQSRQFQNRANRSSRHTPRSRPYLDRIINQQNNPQPIQQQQQQFQKQGDVIFHIGGVNITNTGSQIIAEKYQSFQQKSQLLDKLLENKKIQDLLNNDPGLFQNQDHLQSQKLPSRQLSSETERLKSLSKSRSEQASPTRGPQLINQKNYKKPKKKLNVFTQKVILKDELEISNNICQYEIQEMRIQQRTDLQTPLLVLSVLYILLNFDEKINLVLNSLIIIIAYFQMKKLPNNEKIEQEQKINDQEQWINEKQTKINQLQQKIKELELSQEILIEVSEDPKEKPQEKLKKDKRISNKLFKYIESSESNELEMSDRQNIIDRQGGSQSQNKMTVQNQTLSRQRSNQGNSKRQVIRDVLLKNITQGAILCKITPIARTPRARKLSHADERHNTQINVEENINVNVNNSYNIFLGETSQNHIKLPGLNFNKNRKIEMDIIEMSDHFSRIFQVHYKISNIPCDQLDTFQNSSQRLDEPVGSSYNLRPSHPTGPEASSACKNLYNSNHSLINSLVNSMSINSSLKGKRVSFVRSSSLFSQNQLSSLELINKNGLTLLQQKMMELKIYMPYFISNETIIMYQQKSSTAVPQKLSVMDILEEHFLQKKTTSRLFFKVDSNEELEKTQNAMLNLDDNNSSYSQNKKLNCKSKEMEEIAELNSNLEREKINSIAEQSNDESLYVEMSKKQGGSSDSSRSNKNQYRRKRCQTQDQFSNLSQGVLNMRKLRSSSQQWKQGKLEINDSFSSSSSEELRSYLNQSINNSGHSSKTSEYYENVNSGQQQRRTYSGNDDKVYYFEFEIKQIKDTVDVQDMRNLTFLNIKDVTTLVKNQKKFCDKTYQDAIENNYSHEQMTPLNPIINHTPLVKQNIISLYMDKTKVKRQSSINNTPTIEGFEISDLQRVIQNQKEAKQNLHNIISIEQSAKSIWFYNTNQIQRMKMKKNQVKVEVKPNTNIICTLWNVIWPFEHYVFKRRINIFLVMNLSQNKDMVADWNLYELVFYNILQNALKYNKNVDGDIVITMTCRKARIQANQNQDTQKYMLETQVIDSGVGIEPARQKLLFIPFQELKDRIGITNQSFGSIGLGLACSSDICKKVGGDITLKKSIPGLTVIAFKFPVTLTNKSRLSNSGSNSLGIDSQGIDSAGRKNSSFKQDHPSSSFINLKPDSHPPYPSKFSNNINGKKFEYIKLIGNARPLSDLVKDFLMGKKLFPNQTNLSGSLRNSRSKYSIQPMFKELFSFPNQRIGFQFLESLEKQSTALPSSLSGIYSVKSILSNFNLSQMNSKNQLTNSDKKYSDKSVVKQSSIINMALQRQNSYIQLENKYQLNENPSSLNSDSEDFYVEENILHNQEQSQSQNASHENIIRRSIVNIDLEEVKDNLQHFKMSMIKENDDEQIDSFYNLQMDEEEEKGDSSNKKQSLKREDIILEEEDEEEEKEKEMIPLRPHLKKLRIKAPSVSIPRGQQMELIEEEDGPIEYQPSFSQIFSKIDLHNPDIDQKRLLFHHILNQPKCLKIINKMMNAVPPKKTRRQKPELVRDILINENQDFIRDQGLRKYKKQLKKQEIIYQLSQSSSEENLISSESSSYGSYDDKVIPVEDQRVSLFSYDQDEFEIIPKKIKLRSRVRSIGLQFQEAQSPLIRINEFQPRLSQYQIDKSSLENLDSDMMEEIESVSIPEHSVLRQIVIGSNIISYNNQIFDNLLDKHKDKKCDCEPKILIVEDTEFNMMTICSMVYKKFDIKPFEAQNGQIAIDMVRDALQKPCKCENRAFKLIFMDINMPVKDGHQATKEILQLMKAKGQQEEPIQQVDKYCNIIALTSYTGNAIEKQCLDLNMKIVYNKPLNAVQLKESIIKYFFQSIENLEEYYQLRLMREEINQQMINS